MARCATGSAQFDKTQEVRRATSAIIRSLKGQKVDKLVAHYDLIGTWKNADPNRAYAGLVPVIGGQERLDLSLLVNDLLAEGLSSYPKGDTIVPFTPQDDLHKAAREAWAKSTSYEGWFNAIIAAFPNGFTIEAIDVPCRNSNGGTWINALFGGTKI